MGRQVELTPERKALFLEALRDHGIVAEAARAASPHAGKWGALSTFKDERKRDQDFADAWDEAVEIAADAVERELHRRSVEGYDEPVIFKGELMETKEGEPLTVRRYSDRLMELRIKALKPEKYRERYSVDSTVDATVLQGGLGAVDDLSPESRKMLRELIRGEAARRAETGDE